MGQLSHREDVPFPIFDADNHLYEPPEALTKFLPKEYKDYVQYVQVNGRTKIALRGQISNYIPNPTFEVVARPGAWEAQAWSRPLPLRGEPAQHVGLRGRQRDEQGRALGPEPAEHVRSPAASWPRDRARADGRRRPRTSRPARRTRSPCPLRGPVA